MRSAPKITTQHSIITASSFDLTVVSQLKIDVGQEPEDISDDKDLVTVAMLGSVYAE